MAGRGPVPKRSDKRLGHRSRPVLEVGGACERPPLGQAVHPLAEDWYESLALGPEALFYTPSLWQRARVVAVLLSGLLETKGRPSAQLYTAIQQDMKALLVDAGELRRLGIEVQAVEKPSAEVVDWRGRAAGA